MIGNAGLMGLPKTAFLSSRKVAPQDVMRCYDWATGMRGGGRGATALPDGGGTPGGSAGRLAPPGDGGHAGRVTLPQRARYPAYPILPPPQITPVLLYYAHRKSRRKFNRSEAYEEVM